MIKDYIILEMIWDSLQYVYDECVNLFNEATAEELSEFKLEPSVDSVGSVGHYYRTSVNDSWYELFPSEVSYEKGVLSVFIGDFAKLPNIYEYSKYLAKKLKQDEDAIYDRLEEIYEGMSQEELLQLAGFDLDEITEENYTLEIDVTVKVKESIKPALKEFLYKHLLMFLRVSWAFQKSNTEHMEKYLKNIFYKISIKDLDIFKHLELTGEIDKKVKAFVDLYTRGKNYSKDYSNFEWIEEMF